MLKMIYNVTRKSCNENLHLSRLGLTGFEKIQIDTISFIPLDQKVLSIFQGNPNFSADNIEHEYDEPYEDSWENVNEESENNLDVFPIDEYSSKEEIIGVITDNENKVEEAKRRVEAAVIDQTKDNSTSKPEASTTPKKEE